MKFNHTLITALLAATQLITITFCKAQNTDVKVTTIAGSGKEGFLDGAASMATFKYPQGIAADSLGNVYVSDLGNNKIREITPNGMVFTVADGFTGPNALAFDSKDNLIICDLQQIKKLDKAGLVSTIAGGSGDILTLNDGKAATAGFWNAGGIAVDASDNIYVADYGHELIRKISSDGIVSTFTAVPDEKIDFYSKKTPPHFDYPSAVAVDSKQNVYVAEPYANVILKITPAGVSTIFAGNGHSDSTDGKGTLAGFNFLQGLAIDAHDNLFVADEGNNKIRMITPDGTVTTLAGNGDYASDDGDGLKASFNKPTAIAVDKYGAVYVAEINGNKIRKITFNYDAYLKDRLVLLKINDHHEIDTEPDIDKPDMTKYTDFPKWDTSMDRFGPQYIDAFAEGGIKFRFVHIHDTRKNINIATLERFTNGKWINEIEFEPANHQGGFSHTDDVNGDGYIDITHELRFTSEVYFFNPVTKDFVREATAQINDGIYLVDTAKNIYCDFQEYKRMCNQISSTLYTFEGFNRKDLFRLEFDNCEVEERDTVTKLILQKFVTSKSGVWEKVRETDLKNPFSIDNIGDKFNYLDYWKRVYKKLLGY